MNICPTCHTGRLQRRSIAYLEWHGETLLVVDRMPAIVCDVCGGPAQRSCCKCSSALWS